MGDSQLESTIDKAWEDRESITSATSGEIRDAVEAALESMDSGKERVASPLGDHKWRVNQWLKKAVLLSFRLNDMEMISGGPGDNQRGASAWWDKVPSKFSGWSDEQFKNSGLRAVPNCVVRRSAYIAPGVVLMPSFVNIGAYVDKGTMVDTWATVGSCAQIGKNVHLSGGVGIGGVLEPLQASPVIIEDNVFIGSRCIVVEGVHIKKEAVLGANVVLTKSTKIFDVSKKEAVEIKGFIPERSVVIPGSYKKEFNAGEFNVPCALIIGERKESTDKKTSLNDVLREHGVSV